MTDPLQKLFGSIARLRLTRLFLFNPERSFSAFEAAQKTRVAPREAHKEAALLRGTGVLRRAGRRRPARFMLDPNFLHAAALRALLRDVFSTGDLHARLRGAGAIKLIVVGGVFLGEWGATLDLLVVGERMQDKKFAARIRILESEMGRELSYALLQTQDFAYRLAMNDRLGRDVLDYPHKVVYDRLNIGLM